MVVYDSCRRRIARLPVRFCDVFTHVAAVSSGATPHVQHPPLTSPSTNTMRASLAASHAVLVRPTRVAPRHGRVARAAARVLLPEGAAWRARARAAATSPFSRARATNARAARAAGSNDDDVRVDAAGFDDPLAEQFRAMYPGGSGKRIKWGVFQQTVSAEELAGVDPMGASALRDEAAARLTNIDRAERGRRYKAGAGAAAVCVALAAFQIATGAPPAQRAVMALPLFFAVGFTGSGASGL